MTTPLRSRIVTTDGEIDEALAHAKAAPVRMATSARYDPERDLVEVTLQDGVVVGFPRAQLEGLTDVTRDEAAAVELEAPGTSLVWRALEVAHDIPGLLDGIFGTRRWMAELGARGGAVRSMSKTRAAKKNGKKGGRPRKTSLAKAALGKKR